MIVARISENTGTRPMIARQRELLEQIRVILADGPKNTHGVAMARGDYQSYETDLRDRLLRLAWRGDTDLSFIMTKRRGPYFERAWFLDPDKMARRREWRG